MPSQVYILIAAAAVMFFVIGGLSLLAHYYTLNGIKSRTVGDGQHGTARFASKQEIKNTYKHIPFQPELWRQGKSLPTEQGVILGSQSTKNAVTALVDTDDIHILMIGASGVGKTAFFLYPNMEYACASGMSFLALDTKGDLARNYGSIAQNYYGYNVSVIDLRNPSRSNGNNLLTLINRYMDLCRRQPNNLSARAKAEKYAKILAKTIVNPEGDASRYGQNAFFYDAAEGLLTAVILLLAEYLPPTDENPQEQRHIISVFKLVQDLLEPSKVKGKSQFQLLMNKLPGDHKARWFAGAALNSAEQAMASVMSTVLSRLNAFLDSELEQVLCFDSTIDAETFANEKSAIFLILPEEDQTKNFMAGLMIQNLSRELFSVADENGGKLKSRVVLFCDELGTMPPFDILPLFSAGRSRRLTLVPIIQSLAQLEKNYGKEGSEIVQDNCQDTIFGGFAPSSLTAEVLSKALGSRTVMSGSVSRGKNDPSQSLQMMERPLMTPDELKSIPKGSFVVMKTGTHPMRTKLRLFLDWGIRFGEPYTVEEKANRKVVYADKQALEENIVRRHTACMMVDEETDEILEPPSGTGTLHTPAAEPSENTMRRRSTLKT
ncbi:type IV secretory system conjugative DNA transfer family protein [Dehalobacterium formicoaceticum]|uniref:Type IV secretory system conjugative DNA transfer family protein n=1 Tax=Dehalobacterium formicoaceticum TaxID=51515 RepID=A0ABT1Y8D9_9FIRM|nr:type IV secretory system conjugative DNA transfer family protein [Dehalobacterium formicoaceticum]MCR6547137.1 type IV secretory system conjugative DNA transfer family protein [Dehalobacterium formicoaceticum]